MSSRDKSDTEGVIKAVVERLCEAFSPVVIYLFGSYAYGTPRSHSDLDLLVVIEDDQRRPHERDAAAYMALRGIEMPKDVMVYTRREFEERSSLPVSFERTVKNRGTIIYAA